MEATLIETEQTCCVCGRELDPEWTWWTRNAGDLCSIDCMMESEQS